MGIQSKTAIGSGGIDGKGFLQGTQSQLEFLPESHTDFIIAVLAEELGLIGVLILLSVYFLIIMRCLYLSSRCETLFGRLLSGNQEYDQPYETLTKTTLMNHHQNNN